MLAYLIKYEHLQLTEALRLVKAKRDVRPNDGFLLQLIEFERQCKKWLGVPKPLEEPRW